jgi:phage head maturation protease
MSEEDEENGVAKRTITEFSNLYDVSPVTFPAYEGTDAGMRMGRAQQRAAEAIEEQAEALRGEKALRGADNLIAATSASRRRG